MSLSLLNFPLSSPHHIRLLVTRLFSEALFTVAPKVLFPFSFLSELSPNSNRYPLLVISYHIPSHVPNALSLSLMPHPLAFFH